MNHIGIAKRLVRLVGVGLIYGLVATPAMGTESLDDHVVLSLGFTEVAAPSALALLLVAGCVLRRRRDS
jgi:MYXO-CTERM domain-containing protein